MNPKELLEKEAPLFALEISNKIENKKHKLTTSGFDVNESDPRSDVHYLGSSENKA